MLIGQSVLAPTGGATYYSPWFPRQGDACTVVIETMRASGTLTTFSCQVETKNNEDADSAATNVGSAITITTSTTASATTTAARSGFKELVRYKFTATGSGSTRWIHFRSNPPIWQPN
jgi:hypothetical protein